MMRSQWQPRPRVWLQIITSRGRRSTGSAETAPRAERFAPRFALRSAHSVQRERRSWLTGKPDKTWQSATVRCWKPPIVGKCWHQPKLPSDRRAPFANLHTGRRGYQLPSPVTAQTSTARGARLPRELPLKRTSSGYSGMEIDNQCWPSAEDPEHAKERLDRVSHTARYFSRRYARTWIRTRYAPRSAPRDRVLTAIRKAETADGSARLALAARDRQDLGARLDRRLPQRRLSPWLRRKYRIQ